MKQDKRGQKWGRIIGQAPGRMMALTGAEEFRGRFVAVSEDINYRTLQSRIRLSKVVEARTAGRRVHPSWTHSGRTGGAFLSWCASSMSVYLKDSTLGVI